MVDETIFCPSSWLQILANTLSYAMAYWISTLVRARLLQGYLDKSIAPGWATLHRSFDECPRARHRSWMNTLEWGLSALFLGEFLGEMIGLSKAPVARALLLDEYLGSGIVRGCAS